MGRVTIHRVFQDVIKDLDKSLKKGIRRAKRVTIRKMISDTDPYVPYDTGELSASARPFRNNSGIAYESPHASYAFDAIAPSGRPKVYNTSVHEKATAAPFEVAFDEHIKEWVETFKEELLKEL